MSIISSLLLTPGWNCVLYNLNEQSKGVISSDLCKSMDEFHAIALIDAINVERKKVGQHIIPASDDMCATALFKGLVQKVNTSEGSHDK